MNRTNRRLGSTGFATLLGNQEIIRRRRDGKEECKGRIHSAQLVVRPCRGGGRLYLLAVDPAYRARMLSLISSDSSGANVLD